MLCLFLTVGSRTRRALALAGIPEKEAYDTMGVSQAHFSKQIAGLEHLSAQRLERLPASFHRWYHFLGVLEHGLPEEIEAGIELEKASRAVKRMAKASLPVRAALKERA